MWKPYIEVPIRSTLHCWDTRMDSNSDILLLDRLFANAGPIVCWRLAADFDYPKARTVFLRST